MEVTGSWLQSALAIIQHHIAGKVTRVRLVIITVLLAACLLLQSGFVSLIYPEARSCAVTPEGCPRPPPKEAYVTFISGVTDPGYVDSIRLLHFALTRDPLTADPVKRDFLVIVTERTPEWVKWELRTEGANLVETDVIEGLGGSFGEDDRYRDVYTKLYVWNMTQYDRILFLDGDTFLVKPIHEIWDDPNADPPSGLASLSDAWTPDHDTPIPDHDYLNSGLLLLRTSMQIFKELCLVRDFDPSYPDQNLLNKYFSRDGLYPWAPLDHVWQATHPTDRDLEAGVVTLHEKLWRWKPEGEKEDRRMTELYRERMGRMNGYWMARKQHDGQDLLGW